MTSLVSGAGSIGPNSATEVQPESRGQGIGGSADRRIPGGVDDRHSDSGPGQAIGPSRRAGAGDETGRGPEQERVIGDEQVDRVLNCRASNPVGDLVANRQPHDFRGRVADLESVGVPRRRLVTRGPRIQLGEHGSHGRHSESMVPRTRPCLTRGDSPLLAA